MKKLFLSEESLEKNLHKIYLILALSIGITLSLVMPLFNEPDGQYHYTASTNIAGISNDLSAYGETQIVSGIDAQIPKYQKGIFFESYFQNKIEQMPRENLPRLNVSLPLTTYNFWGHVIPAIGVRIGYTIYPSIGVMVVIARLFTTLLSSLLMFFIIKWVRAGKLLFFAVSLTPVITNSFASLSYDSLTYLIAALTVGFSINILVNNKVRPRDIIILFFISVALFFGAKTNLKLLIGLGPLVMIYVYVAGKSKTEGLIARIYSNKWKIIKYSFFIILVLIAGAFIVKPTLITSLYRILIGYLINFNPSLNVSSIFQSLLAAPYANINFLPFWISAVWYILLAMILFAEKPYVKSKFISMVALVFFGAGIVAVFYSFITYPTTSDTVGTNRFIGSIVGVQGRYFTPTLLLLSLVAGNDKFIFKLKSYCFTVITAIIVIILSNAMLVFGTLFGIYYLS